MSRFQREWTADEQAYIEKAWVIDGHTAAQIAIELGRTRRSVVGRIYRTTNVRHKRVPKVAKPKRIKSRRSPINYTPLEARERKLAIRRNPPAPKPVAENPNGANKALLGDPMLCNGRCRYPLWDDNAFPTVDEMYVCGETTEAGSSWCGFHRDRCFYKQPYREAAE